MQSKSLQSNTPEVFDKFFLRISAKIWHILSKEEGIEAFLFMYQNNAYIRKKYRSIEICLFVSINVCLFTHTLRFGIIGLMTYEWPEKSSLICNSKSYLNEALSYVAFSSVVMLLYIFLKNNKRLLNLSKYIMNVMWNVCTP